MIELYCKRWNGKVSIAVFTELPEASIYRRVENTEACRGKSDSITLTVRSPTRDEKDDPSIFPVNELRNLAIKAVTTTHYLYSDVDFFPSSWMFETISNSSKLLTILAVDYRNTVVIPAFERSIHMCGEINEGLSESEKRTFKECVSKLEMPTDLASVRNQYKKRMVRVFDSKWGDAGHGSTGTTSWLGLKPGKIKKIDCIGSNRYEPYLILRKCSLLPPFQENFTGYGKNKIQHILHIRHLGYRFHVLGGTFITHFPHPASDSRENWNELQASKYRSKMSLQRKIDKGDFHRAKMDTTFHNFKVWLKEEGQAGGDGELWEGTPLCDDATDDYYLLIKNHSKI